MSRVSWSSVCVLICYVYITFSNLYMVNERRSTIRLTWTKTGKFQYKWDSDTSFGMGNSLVSVYSNVSTSVSRSLIVVCRSWVRWGDKWSLCNYRKDKEGRNPLKVLRRENNRWTWNPWRFEVGSQLENRTGHLSVTTRRLCH